jgi:hypothetical protein
MRSIVPELLPKTGRISSSGGCMSEPTIADVMAAISELGRKVDKVDN